ncbi:MAG TPA: FadR/GntR family transcriptional regulator [Clostridia bacterium]|nr:FadR/GntR family transcriptional regulator [Clostridia bacterium]
MKIDPIDKNSLSEQVVNHFIEKLLNGDLVIGDKLPSERDLSEELKISRTTLREGLKILDLMNVIKKEGKKNTISLNDSNLLKESLEIHICTKDIDYLELLEIRSILETETVILAAKKAQKENITELEESLKKMKSNKNNFKQYVLNDVKFHINLAKSTQNNVLLEIYSLIQELLKEYQLKIIKEKNILEKSLEHHKIILKAIKDKNPHKAKEIMKEHLNFTKKEFIDLITKN